MISLKKNIFLLSLLVFITNVSAQKNNFVLGKIQYEKENYQIAIDYLNKYINVEKNNSEAYYIRAKSKFRIKKYNESISDFLNLKAKIYLDANLYLARAYAVKNNEKEAVLYLKKYLNQKSKLPEEQILAYSEFGYIDYCNEWSNLWNENLYSKKEILLLKAKQELEIANYQLAETYLNNYVLKYKANPEVFYLKAKLSVLRANNKDAILYINKAIDLKTDVNYVIIKAEAEYGLKKYKKSLKSFNKAYSIDSLNLQILYGRALVYSALNMNDKAESEIKKYLSYLPNDAKGLEGYAKIMLESEDYLSSINTYGKLIEKYPAEAKYLKERANAYMVTHTYKYAIKDYSMSLDLYPKDAEIYFQRANAYFKLDQVKRACSDWKRAQKYGSLKADKLIYRYCR